MVSIEKNEMLISIDLVSKHQVIAQLPTINIFLCQKILYGEKYNFIRKDSPWKLSLFHNPPSTQRVYQQGRRICFQETFVPSLAFPFCSSSTRLPFFCSTSGGGPWCKVHKKTSSFNFLSFNVYRAKKIMNNILIISIAVKSTYNNSFITSA